MPSKPPAVDRTYLNIPVRNAIVSVLIEKGGTCSREDVTLGVLARVRGSNRSDVTRCLRSLRYSKDVELKEPGMLSVTDWGRTSASWSGVK